MHYILASKSPRRREILDNLGLAFEVVTADTDESAAISDPALLVEELSRRKGLAVRDLLLTRGRDLSDSIIIASDTVVATAEEILGKPHDKPDAARMLHLLSGKTHRVISGVCLIGKDRIGVAHEITEVTFDELDDTTIAHYIEAAAPYDKAGAYAIQGLASAYIQGIRGCYFNVVGLPIHRLNCLHREIFGENLL